MSPTVAIVPLNINKIRIEKSEKNKHTKKTNIQSKHQYRHQHLCVCIQQACTTPAHLMHKMTILMNVACCWNYTCTTRVNTYFTVAVVVIACRHVVSRLTIGHALAGLKYVQSKRLYIDQTKMCSCINTQTHNFHPSFYLLTSEWMPSVLWHCWLGIRKSIWPVKIHQWGVGCGYLSAARCRLFAYVPDDATAIAKPHNLVSFKSRLVLPFWYWLTQVVR